MTDQSPIRRTAGRGLVATRRTRVGSLLATLLVMLLALALSGCDGGQNGSGSDNNGGNGGAGGEGGSTRAAMEEAARQSREAAEAVGQAAQRAATELAEMSKREFIEHAQQRLEDLDAAMQHYAQQAKAQGEAAQEQFQQWQRDFDQHQAQARQTLEKVSVASGDAWRDIAGGFTEAAQQMHEAFAKARQRFEDAPATQP